MPDQHREFYTALPWIVCAGADRQDRVWVSLLDGPEGFIQSPSPTALRFGAEPSDDDPLHSLFDTGGLLGLLGIELHTRRRNRVNGRISHTGAGRLHFQVSQSFGNCPQSIHQRGWSRVEADAPAAPVQRTAELTPQHQHIISQADTLFIGSGFLRGENADANGYDASHRNGRPGFVHIDSSTRLRVPDYPGNQFFNTIGNLQKDPRVGLLFVDFATGDLLHLSGTATIDWQASKMGDALAQRSIDVDVNNVIARPGATRLRWKALDV